MSNIPKELKYSNTHEWVRIEDDGCVTVGISDHAQTLLGELVYVELPEVGDQLNKEEECCVVESVKAASDVYAPVSGIVIAVNTDLVDSPEQVNLEPYDGGWLFKLEVDNLDELEELLDCKEYQETTSEEA